MNAPVTIPDPMKEALQRLTDDPRYGCKVTAAKAGVDRKTINNIMRHGTASERTIRKIQSFVQLSPHSPSEFTTA
jgi:hypothetical protein